VVIAEAMAAGRPVVATAVGGVPYMVTPGRTGWLVPPEDEEALAGAVVAALQSVDRARTMGMAAREEAVKRFHPRPLAERHVEVYREVMARWRSGSAQQNIG